MHEVGAASVIAGVQLRTLVSNKGELNPDEVKAKIRSIDIHFPDTGLICLENAHSNGRVIPLENMEKIYNIAKEKNIPLHLDGARIFNAATHLNVKPREIAKYADSVNICLSKGLCAPIGSVLVGSKEFIDKARRGRKLMGGGMRQVGILAAPGIIALTKMSQRLKTDHDNAKLMGELLSKIPGIKINTEDIHINMVFFDMEATGYETSNLEAEFYKKGIKINPVEDGLFRFVTNYWVTTEDIYYIIDTLKEILKV
jgi:threonine aldolase